MAFAKTKEYLPSFNAFLLLAVSVFIIVFILRTIAAIVLQDRIIKFSMSTQVELRETLLNKLAMISIDEYKKKPQSEHILETTALIGHYTSKGLMPTMRLVADIFIAVVLLGFMLINAFYITLTVILIASVIVILCFCFLKEKYHNDGVKANKAYKDVIDLTGSYVNGLYELIVKKENNKLLHEIVEKSKRMAFYEGKNQLLNVVPKYSLELIIILIFLSGVITINMFSNDKLLAYSTLITFMMIGVKLLPAVLNFIQVLINLSFFRNSVEKIKKSLDTKNFNHSVKCIGHFNLMTISSANLKIGNRIIFNNLNIKIRCKDKIAICGPSGCGKSTLLEILLGFKSFDESIIHYDNRILEDKFFSLREICSYIPQNPLLINSSIRNNLMLENIDVDENYILNMIKSVNLDQRLGKDPLNFQISDDGKTLSGGERQRIAILRALLSQKEIILMDEITSSLDDDIAVEVVGDMLRIFDDRTVVLVTHSKKIAKMLNSIIYL